MTEPVVAGVSLVEATARGVLGEFTHTLKFPIDHDFAIIYGPNGVGKTKFLEILHAATRLDGGTLAKLPFKSVTLKYSDGSRLRAVSTASFTEAGDLRQQSDVTFIISQVDQEVTRWRFEPNAFEIWLENNTSWHSIGAELWEDRQDGEVATIVELQGRYPEANPGRRRLRRVPPDFTSFSRTLPSFLIETQRLRIENQPPSRTRNIWQTSSRMRSQSRIKDQATVMQGLVNEAQTEHSRLTQQLDRTFPSRVLSNTREPTGAEQADIRKRYNEQNIFRSRLGRVVSVTLSDELSLPDRDLVTWELKLLSLYLDDADIKLAPFEGLLQKVELLEEIVNSRVLRKKLQVTAERGFTVLQEGNGREIDLDSLSSGEQHEIILMFDLLFNVPPGALVLIDEPEISLHVVWQLSFIPDVRRIADLADFRFVVATHSPQIINDAWDRATRLGPPEEAFA